MTQVLVIEDEEVLARTITQYLRKRGFTCQNVATAAKGIEAHGRLRPALTLLDYRLGHDNPAADYGTLRRLAKPRERAALRR